MSEKRAAFTSLSHLVAKKEKIDTETAVERSHHLLQQQSNNPFLSRPVNPEDAIKIFLIQARQSALRHSSSSTINAMSKKDTTNFHFEIEGRLGILKTTSGGGDRFVDARVLSSGPKRVPMQGKSVVATAFLCSSQDSMLENDSNKQQPRCNFEAGTSRSHFLQWTMGGLSEASPISTAFGVRLDHHHGGMSESSILKRDLVEYEKIETVYTGYPGHYRVCFPGERNTNPNEDRKTNTATTQRQPLGRMETKIKIQGTDIALPSAPYDLRLTLSTEEVQDAQIQEPPTGWDQIRLKKRRTFSRKDNSFAWILDVTEVATTTSHSQYTGKQKRIEYEIEFELNNVTTSKLLSETDPLKANNLCNDLSKQLWWMISQINPNSDVLSVDDFLREHPNQAAVRLALAQCHSIKQFVETKQWSSAIASSSSSMNQNSSSLPTHSPKINFPGCMPINFSRHHVDEIQQNDENAYFLSEKTDGVRHFMIFTGETTVLVDRAMKGKQPIPIMHDMEGANVDPMLALIQSVKKGAVLDGEVVMHRKLRRPVFIVFDVLCVSADHPILHLNFEQRLIHLTKATFCIDNDPKIDIFSESEVVHPTTALPLVRKNFVKRTQIDRLFDHIHEEKGLRHYRMGNTHNHLTDGIIFQPNTPYVCSTDNQLLKWKYIDVTTIDVQILPSSYQDESSKIRVGVLGEEGTIIDMTRFINLPVSDRLRLEADQNEANGCKIIEVGFDPTVGDWYYRSFRVDKTTPNHISTVLGTFLEISEGLTTEELRYRISVPAGYRDNYRRDSKRMQKQLLDHQREQYKNASQQSKK